ncbi:Lipopolysaccharide heptosyltransferase [Melioribacter roseus P3M-2]|uniref:Lipopolysaccharide heptosyltransferase n=1 Tax=Melioribacter roseus (strain DSM 23840 / JCM 17771 / VKM B-2668 / P3M-2) TaxID=1191523 RepID=I6Z2L8_MELRP|nr:glycosyltransferase family 9 protein [Melioribacter roseus]AFN73385.1 Lipopolysaccharide heptosyltransferase [Melioribacter roseus P3M-2]
MSRQKKNPFESFLKKYFSVESLNDFNLGLPKRILIVRQHNQLGDMLASVSLFRAVKESFPTAEVTLIASPENFYAVTKNKFIDKLFVFDKKKIFNPFYIIKLFRVLRKKYDVAIVPATVAISKTSCILAAFSNTAIKIGPASLNGKENYISYLFHYGIDLDWRVNPDAHVSDFILDIVRPFKVTTKDFKSRIEFDQKDMDFARNFALQLEGEKLVGFHVGAGKPQNRWPMENFLELIKYIKEKFKAKIYITGSSADRNEIEFLRDNLNFEAGYFINRSIPEIAALISISDLFITNDTGIMHVAGATETPQISLFGPTNPFNWAPLGNNKFFLRKSDLVSDIGVDEVISLCNSILNSRDKEHAK